jgi:hypothetical protein
VDNGLLNFPLEFPQLKNIHLSAYVYPDHVIATPHGSQSSYGSSTASLQPQHQQRVGQGTRMHQPQQRDGRADAYYSKHQEQERRFSAPFNPARYEIPENLVRARSTPNPPYSPYGKRKGGPDKGNSPAVELHGASAGPLYFTHDRRFTATDSLSAEGRSHESSEWISRQKDLEYSSFSAVRGSLNRYPTPAIELSSQFPTVYSSSRKHELLHTRQTLADPEGWRKLPAEMENRDLSVGILRKRDVASPSLSSSNVSKSRISITSLCL